MVRLCRHGWLSRACHTVDHIRIAQQPARCGTGPKPQVAHSSKGRTHLTDGLWAMAR